MSGHPRDTSATGRGRSWILGPFLVAVIALYAVYFYALYLIVSVIS